MAYSTVEQYVFCVFDALEDVEQGRGAALRNARPTHLLLMAAKRHLGNGRTRARVLTLEEIQHLATMEMEPHDARDAFRLVLLIAFLGGFRLGSLLPTGGEPHPGLMRLSSLSVTTDGLVVATNYSKVNQYGETPRRICLSRSPDGALCPVKAYLNVCKTQRPDCALWELHNNVRSFSAFIAVCQRAISAKPGVAGQKADITGHSFRRSFVHHSLNEGFSLADIMVHGDWSDTKSLVTSYAAGAVLPSVDLLSRLGGTAPHGNPSPRSGASGLRGL